MGKIAHIVIRDYNGEYHRIVDDSCYVQPHELLSYEEDYAITLIDKTRPCYDALVRRDAIVVNVFYTEVPDND